MRLVLHPDARDEFRAAAIWYEEQREGLGVQFVSEVNAVLERIRGAPLSFPPWPGVSSSATPQRRAVVHRFPYVVAFETQGDQILVLAIAHGKRRPLYWIARAARPV